MKVGDAIVLSAEGRLSFAPNDGSADEDLRGKRGSSRLLGIVVDVREPEGDSVIKTWAPEPNQEPPLVTLEALKKMVLEGEYS